VLSDESSVSWSHVSGEVTKNRRSFHYPHSANAPCHRVDVLDDFSHVIDVTVRVDPAWKGEPHELEISRTLASIPPASEHHRANLRCSNPAFQVENE
jgi:hypothetical protein